MDVRFLSGIVAGLAIGLVISEALIAGAGLLLPEFDLATRFTGQGAPERMDFVVTALVYALAAGLGATMAAAIAGPTAGGLCGMMWLVPFFLLGSLSNGGELLSATMAIAGLGGTLLGIRLAVGCPHGPSKTD